MSSICFRAAAAAAVLWLAGCEGASLRLTYTDNNTTVRVNTGEYVEVELRGNPSAGYTWQTDSINAAVLRQTGEPDFIADSGMVGAGGTFVFRYECVGAGTSRLRLVYNRTFDSRSAPAQTFNATVLVAAR